MPELGLEIRFPAFQHPCLSHLTTMPPYLITSPENKVILYNSSQVFFLFCFVLMAGISVFLDFFFSVRKKILGTLSKCHPVLLSGPSHCFIFLCSIDHGITCVFSYFLLTQNISLREVLLCYFHFYIPNTWHIVDFPKACN